MSKQTDFHSQDPLWHDQDAPHDPEMLLRLYRQRLAQGQDSPPGPGENTFSNEIQMGLLRHELQEARDKYALLYDYVPVGYLTLDPEAEVLEANLTLCNWLETEKNRLIGANFQPYIERDGRTAFLEALQSTLHGNHKQSQDLFLKKKNGGLLAVNLEISGLRDALGQFSRVFCIFNDASSRYRQADTDQVHRLVMDLCDQAILATDRNLNLTDWNKAAESLFGWLKAEVLTPNPVSRIHRQIMEPFISKDILDELTDQGIWNGQVNCRDKEGAQLECRAAIGVIWDSAGRFNGLAVVCHQRREAVVPPSDGAAPSPLEHQVRERTQELSHTIQVLQQEINLHKQAALAARESEGRNRDLVDNIRLGIFRCTPGLQGRFLEVNKAMEEISGFNREELLQVRTCDLFACESDLSLFISEINVADWKLTHELELVKKDGQKVTVSITIVAIRFESGKTQYLDGILEDITERKQAQQQIQYSLQRLQKTIKEIIEAMAYIGEVRDPYTAGHQRRVAQLSLEIGREMGLQDEQFEGLRMAAFVHDIGKILVPSDILSKPGKLSKPEFDMLRDHTRIGYEILKTIEFPWPIATIVLQHHERINGSGYPFGLSGEQIIIEARILAVADVVEAMSSHRPYRPALGIDQALDEITRNRGVLYDAAVVDSCLRVFAEKNYDLN